MVNICYAVWFSAGSYTEQRIEGDRVTHEINVEGDRKVYRRFSEKSMPRAEPCLKTGTTNFRGIKGQKSTVLSLASSAISAEALKMDQIIETMSERKCYEGDRPNTGNTISFLVPDSRQTIKITKEGEKYKIGRVIFTLAELEKMADRGWFTWHRNVCLASK